MPRIRFTVRTMMIAVAICTIAVWVLCLPGRRAQRLARLIHKGDTEAALAMLSDLPETALQYRTVVEHVASNAHRKPTTGTKDLRRIEIKSPTLWQVLIFQRTVWVGNGLGGGGDCEFVVTPFAVRPGRNHFSLL